jgi:hypothetical protein
MCVFCRLDYDYDVCFYCVRCLNPPPPPPPFSSCNSKGLGGKNFPFRVAFRAIQHCPHPTPPHNPPCRPSPNFLFIDPVAWFQYTLQCGCMQELDSMPHRTRLRTNVAAFMAALCAQLSTQKSDLQRLCLSLLTRSFRTLNLTALQADMAHRSSSKHRASSHLPRFISAALLPKTSCNPNCTQDSKCPPMHSLCWKGQRCR